VHPDIHGLWPALLTPVGSDGTLDIRRALQHAHRMLQAGCDGVTLFGTTGEGPAFTLAERKALLEALLADRVQPDQIIVTITTLALGEAIELGRHASALGVHRMMLMPPFFFNQPKESGVVKATSQVVRGIEDPRLKLLLYHFPAMSTFSFSHAAIGEIVHSFPEQVVGVKDSSGDLEHAFGLARAFPKLAILVGAEPHVAPVMAKGGSGSINGLANIAPRLMKRVMSRPDRVAYADEQLVLDLLKLLSIRPGMPFVSVYKAMLAEQTGDNAWLHVRAPLCPLENGELQAVRNGYRALGAALEHL
jgi:4-hydroxy-tetrahydrodipicolinate synthase